MKTIDVIALTIDYNHGDYDDVTLLPLQENLDEEGCETFEELKVKWESLKWGYYADAKVELRTIDPAEEGIADPNDTFKCSEFYGVHGFSDLAVDPEFYSRPFENSPNGALYINRYAVDCERGDIYSKDFAYSTCDVCQRTICQQNPSNGWMGHFHQYDGYEICNKCHEEKMFDEGSDVGEVLRTKSLGDAGFFSSGELEDKGFEVVDGFDSVTVGHGRSGYGDPDSFFNRLGAWWENNKNMQVIFCVESMAIGGMGGYVTVYAKIKESITK